MTLREGLERFTALSLLQVRAQNPLQRGSKFVRADAGEDLAADFAVVAKTAADEDVIGINAFAVDACLGSEATEVANVMLRARVRAAGDVNINRLVQFDTLFE